MKILLIRPPVPKHTIGLKNIMICEPLELEYAGAGLQGHEVQIFDMIVEKNLQKRLQQFNPDVIGTSSYISGVNEVIKICRQVKNFNRNCYTIVGGVQAAKVPEDFIDNSVDVIVRGDGAIYLPLIIHAIENKLPFDDIPNLSFPVSNSELKNTRADAYMQHPDSLPLPDRNLTAHLRNKYYYLMHRPVVTMKTAWGCWYKCNFCYTWQITGGTPYVRSAENIIEELLTIESKEIYIVDDIFLIKPSRLREIADLLKKHNIKKNYLVYSRSDFITEHEEIIQEWADLGLKAVFIGLEAVTDDELTSMNKENSVDKNIQAIKILQKCKIDIYGSLIPHPDYTVKDWQRLRKFIHNSGLYYLNISPLMPLPGTTIWKDFEDRITVPRQAHGLWDLSHALIKTKLSLRQYYWQLLKTYATVAYNLPRAKKVTHRTITNIWSWQYFQLIWGSAKIGWQFLFAYKHHSKKQIAKAMERGKPVLDYPYAAARLLNNEVEVFQQKFEKISA